MSYTVRQFVEGALEELGMASYVFDLTPEQLQAGASRMVAMLAEWNALGIRIGATLYGTPDGIDISADTGIPDKANTAIITNLAIRLAPSYGKAVSAETRTNAKLSYNTLLFSVPPQMQMPRTMPAGAGNKAWRWGDDPFLIPPQEPLSSGAGQVLEF